MNASDVRLPVPVLDSPHWRVIIRPDEYRDEVIPSLSECFKLIEQTKVRLRGWDYPHISHRQNEREQGSNWISSWSQFHRSEYWRLYQSGQFVHLFGFHEDKPDWKKELRHFTKTHLHGETVDVDKIPGFISIVNFIYTITEIFEFAARLAEKGIFNRNAVVLIELHGIKGYTLTTESDRAWWGYYAASQDVLSRSWEIPGESLISDSPRKALDAILWFLERFGWLDPNIKVIQEDQKNFLEKNR